MLDSARALRGLLAKLSGQDADSCFEGIDWTEREEDVKRPWVLSAALVSYCQYLWRSGQSRKCRSVVRALQKFAEANWQQDDLVRSLILQGQLELETGKVKDAEIHFDDACNRARNFQHKLILVEALVRLYQVKRRRKRNHVRHRSFGTKSKNISLLVNFPIGSACLTKLPQRADVTRHLPHSIVRHAHQVVQGI